MTNGGVGTPATRRVTPSLGQQRLEDTRAEPVGSALCFSFHFILNYLVCIYAQTQGASLGECIYFARTYVPWSLWLRNTVVFRPIVRTMLRVTYIVHGTHRS